MPDIFLFPGEANPYDIKLRDPTIAEGGGPAGGLIKVWMGAAWLEKPVKVWLGASWLQKPVKFWNGTSWTLT